jgi:hypothetical protein
MRQRTHAPQNALQRRERRQFVAGSHQRGDDRIQDIGRTRQHQSRFIARCHGNAAGLLGPRHDARVFTNCTKWTRSLDGIGVLQLHCFSKAQMDAEVIDNRRGNFVRTGEPVPLLEEL